MTNLNKLGGLTPGERRILFQSILLLPIIQIVLFFLGYYHLHRILEKLFPLKRIDNPCPEAEILQQARGIARIVSIAAEHGFLRATCLRRSLMVWTFLRTRGVQSNICFGVRLVDHELQAHAWVEYNHKIVNDSEIVIENYKILRDVLPPTNSGL